MSSFKWLLRVISIFGFACFPFFWMLPESFRWLLVKRKYTKAVGTVENAAKINGIKLSPKTYDIIAMKCQHENSMENIIVENSGTFMDIIKSFSLFTRLIICAFCWVSSTFITYGVSILSVQLQGDKYVNILYFLCNNVSIFDFIKFSFIYLVGWFFSGEFHGCFICWNAKYTRYVCNVKVHEQTMVNVHLIRYNRIVYSCFKLLFLRCDNLVDVFLFSETFHQSFIYLPLCLHK